MQDNNNDTSAADQAAQAAGYIWSGDGMQAATNGTPPPAGPYDVTVITNSSTNNTELQFSFAPGVQLGDAFLYEGATSGSITGLTPGTVYYAIPDASNANAFALADSPQDAALGNALPISGSATINLGPAPPAPTPPTAWPAVISSNSFTFAAGTNPGYETGDQIIYRGATDSNGNAVTINTTDPNNVAGTLQVGQFYYAVVDPSSPNVVQLADTLANAQANHPLTLSATTTSVNVTLLTSSLLAAVSNNALNFTDGTDQGLSTGDPVLFGGATDLAGNAIAISTVDPNGVSGSLQSGQTYYAIVDPNNPNIVQFAATLAHAQNNQPLQLSSPSANVLATLLTPLPANVSPFATNLPPLLVDFGTLDLTAAMSGSAHTLSPRCQAGVNVTTNLVSRERGDSTPQQGKAYLQGKISIFYLKRQITAGKQKNLVAFANASEALKKELIAQGKLSPEDLVQNAPGASGTAPPYAAAGSFSVMASVDKVRSVVSSTAVISSMGDVNIKSTMSNLVQDSSQAGLVVDPASSAKAAVALAATITVMEPTVTATVADNAAH